MSVIFGIDSISLDNGWCVCIDEGAVCQVEARGEACRIDFHVSDAAADGVDDEGRGTVCHVEVYVEVLAHPLQHVHLQSCREQACGVRREGVGIDLPELGGVAVFVGDEVDHDILHQVGGSQMHVLAHGQIERVTCLVGIHHVLVVLQPNEITLSVVEGEVDVVGKIGEDGGKILAQC